MIKYHEKYLLDDKEIFWRISILHSPFLYIIGNILLDNDELLYDIYLTLHTRKFQNKIEENIADV